METFPYIVQHKKGKDNVVADALSRRYVLLTHCDAHVLGFALMKELYASDGFFKDIYAKCLANGEFESFLLITGICLKLENFVYPNLQLGTSSP